MRYYIYYQTTKKVISPVSAKLKNGKNFKYNTLHNSAQKRISAEIPEISKKPDQEIVGLFTRDLMKMNPGMKILKTNYQIGNVEVKPFPETTKPVSSWNQSETTKIVIPKDPTIKPSWNKPVSVITPKPDAPNVEVVVQEEKTVPQDTKKIQPPKPPTITKKSETKTVIPKDPTTKPVTPENSTDPKPIEAGNNSTLAMVVLIGAGLAVFSQQGKKGKRK